MVKIKIIWDLNIDAENRWKACNSTFCGMNWKKIAKPEDVGVVEKIVWIDKDSAIKILIEYLGSKYNKEDIDERIENIDKELKKPLNLIVSSIEKINKIYCWLRRDSISDYNIP